MKALKIILIFSLAFFHFFVKAQPCMIPVNAVNFQQIKRNISSIPINGNRLMRAKETVQSNCLTTVQLAEIMQLFGSDVDRFELASIGINTLTDHENAYLLMDQFRQFSFAFYLYDMLHAPVLQPVQSNLPITQLPTSPPVPVMLFPILNYPEASVYNGKRNCTAYLAENDFMVYAQDVFSKPNEGVRMDAALALVSKTCLSVAQLMKLASLLSIENNRLELLKLGYRNVFDEQNFDFAQQVFSHQPNKIALAEFLKANRTVIVETPVPPPCVVSPQQFQMLRENLARESSSNTRLTVAKNQIPVMKCFTSQQMKEILSLFSSSIDRLDLAKFAYGFILDRDMYYLTVSSVFSSSLDKENLSNYIKKQP
jgi:hypothetical protein